MAYLREITREPVRQIITAGGKDELVLDGGIGGHSVFTGRLIEALEAVQEFVTARELGLKLQMQVYGDAAARGHSQKPQFGEIYGTGDFVFVPDSAKRALMEKDKVATLKLPGLKRDSAQKEAQSKAHEEQQTRLNVEEQERWEKERRERLPGLERGAEKPEFQIESSVRGPGLLESAEETRKINEAMAELDTDFARKRRQQVARLESEYQGRTALVSTDQPEPWYRVFESELQHKQRIQDEQERRKSIIQALVEARSLKRQELEDRLNMELEARKAPLRERIRGLMSRRFELLPSQVEFELLTYSPGAKWLEVVITLNQSDLVSPDGEGPLRLFGNLPVAEQHKAAQFHEQPNLLIPFVTLRVSEAGEVVVDKAVFGGPENEQIVTVGVSPVWVDPIMGMKFSWVPGGCYEMGCGSWTSNCDEDEKPLHEACVDGLWLGKYEVTQGEWKKLMGSNPSYFQNGDSYPVEQVSWNGVKEFIERLNSRSSDGSYRLPTEAEWEYACRSGGKPEKFSGGNEVDRLAWHDSNSESSTHAVSVNDSNGLGIFEMSGNVREWCEDVYDKNAYAKHSRNNPVITYGGFDRVNRGGGWVSNAEDVRCSNRDWNHPDGRYGGLGFRLVKEP
ncbi:MAG: SUMF1/EgtB/PvdO family nonheme iron enzyme [Deltaproteobacteria bacterium]|nr:SUMF1/EgtB/PvdO family nonheme iron enzyme [Deltaproteobacteria bacterium]